jgi:ABC-type uncharacterized transport system involved in gliding motility auxiliary subunit
MVRRRQLFKTRGARYGAYAGVYIIVIALVLGAINFLANRYDKAWDTTANKQFTLADQTINIVKKLPHDVTIYYFDDTTRFPEARNMLDRYSSLSPRLHVEYIDPVKKPQDAKAHGYQRSVNILVNSGTKTEQAKGLSEEELTGALIRSLKSGDRNVCFVTGSGESAIDDSDRSGYASAKEALERNNYKTRAVNLLSGTKAAAAAAGNTAPASAKIAVPDDCTLLVVAGPQHNYVQQETDAIKNYVEHGGKALFLLDPPLNLGKTATDENTTLVKMLDGWGVTVRKDLALDLSGVGEIFGLSAAVPLVDSYDPHAITNSLKNTATAFPLSRTLEIRPTEQATVQKLFSTSEGSVATTNLSSPAVRPDLKNDKKGPLVLAAAGTFNAMQKDSSKGRFIVVGSSQWLGNNFIRFNGNRDLFLNMANWLSADEDLISIRPKAPQDRPLNITPQKLVSTFWLSVVVFPLGVVLFGLATWWKRR